MGKIPRWHTLQAMIGLLCATRPEKLHSATFRQLKILVSFFLERCE